MCLRDSQVSAVCPSRMSTGWGTPEDSISRELDQVIKNRNPQQKSKGKKKCLDQGTKVSDSSIFSAHDFLNDSELLISAPGLKNPYLYDEGLESDD